LGRGVLPKKAAKGAGGKIKRGSWKKESKMVLRRFPTGKLSDVEKIAGESWIRGVA